MNIDSLEKLYVHELKDLYSAENQLLDALPRLIKAASDAGLQEALEGHRKETAQHVKRIESLFTGLEYEPGGHRCQGMEGLLKEAVSTLGDVTGDGVIDAAIIAGCQRVEHYEIAGYGVARAFAAKLGRHADVEVLTQTLEEEGAADRRLTQVAERSINFSALVV